MLTLIIIAFLGYLVGLGLSSHYIDENNMLKNNIEDLNIEVKELKLSNSFLEQEVINVQKSKR